VSTKVNAQRIILTASAALGVVSALSGAALGWEGSQGNMCSADWILEQRARAGEAAQLFGILADTAFQERESSYLFGIFLPQGANVSALTFAIFRGAGDAFQQVYAEQIETSAAGVSGLAAALKGSCMVSNLGSWFEVAVADLDADGRAEIVVQSSAAESCGTCLSEVRVYQVKGAAVAKVVEETYSQLIFGPGGGLSLRSFTRGPGGEIIPTAKRFFVGPRGEGPGEGRNR
jgi:hypothetical protein